MKTRSLTVLGLFVVLALPAGQARAALVTWVFEGTLRVAPASIPATLSSLGVQIGAPVSGFVQFESTTSDASGTPPVGQYFGAVVQSEISIGAWTLTQDVNAFFHDFIVGAEPGNSFAFTSVDSIDPTGANGGITVIALELSDSASAFFTDTSLPLAPPPLSILDPFGPNPVLGFGTDVAVFGTTGDYRAELSLLRVPEPLGTRLLLLAAPLLALAGRRSRGVARWSPREAIDEPSTASLRDLSRAVPSRS